LEKPADWEPTHPEALELAMPERPTPALPVLHGQLELAIEPQI
jgi:hypothetical protein